MWAGAVPIRERGGGRHVRQRRFRLFWHVLICLQENIALITHSFSNIPSLHPPVLPISGSSVRFGACRRIPSPPLPFPARCHSPSASPSCLCPRVGISLLRRLPPVPLFNHPSSSSRPLPTYTSTSVPLPPPPPDPAPLSPPQVQRHRHHGRRGPRRRRRAPPVPGAAEPLVRGRRVGNEVCV